MCSFLNNLFTVTGNNNTMNSKNRVGNKNVHSKLPVIVFQINSISLIESEEFWETSIVSQIVCSEEGNQVENGCQRGNIRVFHDKQIRQIYQI